MEVEEARLWENSSLEKLVSFFLLVLINNTVIQIFSVSLVDNLVIINRNSGYRFEI